MQKLFFLLLLLLFTVSCQRQQIREVAKQQNLNDEIITDNFHPTALIKSKKCGSCHREIYEEWAESIHAKSSYFQDEIHRAVVNAYQKFKKSKNKPVDYHCANCHTPVVEDQKQLLQAQSTLSANKHQEGVSCRSCHSMIGIEHAANFDRPVYSPEAIVVSAKRRGFSPPHKVKKYPFQNNSQVCLSCHAHKHNGKGTGICVMTGKEGEVSNAKQANCIACHMPEVENSVVSKHQQVKTHISHRFPGSRNRDLLASAIKMDAHVKDGKLKVNLENIITHAFPSSQPMRQAGLIVQAYSKGKLLWTNRDSLRPKDKTLLMVALANKKGKWPVPPWMAHHRAFDTRLMAGEKRTYQFDQIPLEKVDQIEVKLLYRLLAPAMAKAFKVDDKHALWQEVTSLKLSL